MRIATVNWYMGNRQPEKDIARLSNLYLDAIGFQEVWRDYELIDRKLEGFKVFTARRSDSRASNEVAVALNTRRNRYLGHSGMEVSDVTPDEESKIFKSRWVTAVRFEKNGKKYVLLNHHANAAVQNKNTGRLFRGSERVREFVEGMRELNKMIKYFKERGYRIFVTGDFNYRNAKWIKDFVLAYWSPQRVFKRNGLDYYEHGLDYVAWSKSMHKKKVTVIPADQTGSDHPWIIVETV